MAYNSYYKVSLHSELMNHEALSLYKTKLLLLYTHIFAIIWMTHHICQNQTYNKHEKEGGCLKLKIFYTDK